MNREERINEKVKKLFYKPYDYRNGFIDGAQWADEHPNGFIYDFHGTKDITNKEFIEMLKQYPEDAYISVECCNPRAMVYDEKNNLIRID